MDRQTSDEVGAIRSIVSTYKPGGLDLLDLGCGVGRHAGPLSELGYRVTGVDHSDAVLAVARARFGEVQFVSGDFREFRLPSVYSAAYIMWTTFNYLGTDADALRFFRCVSAHLEGGGLLIIDLKNFEATDPVTEYSRHSENRAYELDLLVRKHRRAGLSIAYYHYELRDKRTGGVTIYRDQEIARIYPATDVVELAGSEAFKLLDIYGGYGLQPFDPSHSGRALIVLSKAEDVVP